MRYYIVDAFTETPFKGNPAGVCLLDSNLDDKIMQNIASENNLSETAFLLKENDEYLIRWFTPEVEIDLCGHATLATSFVLMNYVDPSMESVSFNSKSGNLSVKRKKDLYFLNFPARKPKPCEIPNVIKDALKVDIIEAYKSRDLMVVVENEDTVRNLKPDFSMLKDVGGAFGIIVTAKGESVDFVSRFFAPGAGIPEDPVTGSSHCTLIPFWSERLGKSEMEALQLSKRGGRLYCKNLNDRVEIGGRAVCYLKGEILI